MSFQFFKECGQSKEKSLKSLSADNILVAMFTNLVFKYYSLFLAYTGCLGRLLARKSKSYEEMI